MSNSQEPFGPVSFNQPAPFPLLSHRVQAHGPSIGGGQATSGGPFGGTTAPAPSMSSGGSRAPAFSGTAFGAPAAPAASAATTTAITSLAPPSSFSFGGPAAPTASAPPAPQPIPWQGAPNPMMANWQPGQPGYTPGTLPQQMAGGGAAGAAGPMGVSGGSQLPPHQQQLYLQQQQNLGLGVATTASTAAASPTHNHAPRRKHRSLSATARKQSSPHTTASPASPAVLTSSPSTSGPPSQASVWICVGWKCFDPDTSTATNKPADDVYMKQLRDQWRVKNPHDAADTGGVRKNLAPRSRKNTGGGSSSVVVGGNAGMSMSSIGSQSTTVSGSTVGVRRVMGTGSGVGGGDGVQNGGPHGAGMAGMGTAGMSVAGMAGTPSQPTRSTTVGRSADKSRKREEDDDDEEQDEVS
ncbi:hypothetical protein HDV00_010165 [Rhizophlyctis rosea]|nr:hypothetical protein HDV00_010165 [Rhizophlyctis rosea]